MKSRIARLAILVVVIGVAILLWNYFFPSPEKMIRRRLAGIARQASFSVNESPIAKLQNSKQIAASCTEDVEVTIDAAGYRHALAGRDELFQMLMFARSQLSSLNLDFLDPTIAFPPNKQSAIVSLTIRATAGGDREMIVQECKFSMKKVGRNWLIRKIETVKTLSQGSTIRTALPF